MLINIFTVVTSPKSRHAQRRVNGSVKVEEGQKTYRLVINAWKNTRTLCVCVCVPTWTMLSGTERAVRSCGRRLVCRWDNLPLKFSALSGAGSGGNSHCFTITVTFRCLLLCCFCFHIKHAAFERTWPGFGVDKAADGVNVTETVLHLVALMSTWNKNRIIHWEKKLPWRALGYTPQCCYFLNWPKLVYIKL